jgi:nitrate/nitrite transporter NarK
MPPFAIGRDTAIGNLGDWLTPTAYGVAKGATGSTDIGLLCLAVPLIISVIGSPFSRKLKVIGKSPA